MAIDNTDTIDIQVDDYQNNTDTIDIQVDDYQNNAKRKECLFSTSVLCIFIMIASTLLLAIITFVIYAESIISVIVNIAIFVSDNIWIIWFIILSLLFFFILIMLRYKDTTSCKVHTPV